MMEKNFRVHLNREFSKNCLLISPKNLYAVLTLNWLFDPIGSGIPPELVEKIYDDHNGLQIETRQVTADGDFRVLYVSVEESDEPINLLRVISVMNQVAQMSISIYCSQEQRDLVKDYANENIQFVSRKEGHEGRKPVALKYDLVITFGPGALHFVRQEIPVMIIGPYGFGGMVSARFLPYLIRDGFMGRPGGNYGEIIPASIVQEGLLDAKMNRSSSSVLQSLKSQVSELSFCPLSAQGELVSRVKGLHQQLYDKDARWHLKPKLASNVEILKKDELFYIKRLTINDTLAVVNPRKVPFFHQIDAKRNCSALYDRLSISKSDFWQYMYTFWEKKIIVF